MTIATEPSKIPRKFLERQSGYTTHLLGECITNLALGKSCIFLIANYDHGHYMMNLARSIAHRRGFPEAREKMNHQFSLRNGGVSMMFVSLLNENILSVNDGLAFRASNQPLFVDHYVWETRENWPPHLRTTSFYAEPVFGKSCYSNL